MKRAIGLIVIIWVMAVPAYACPVCGFGRDGTTSMYLLTAAFMSLVPLLMAGAIVYYLIRLSRRVTPLPPSPRPSPGGEEG